MISRLTLNGRGRKIHIVCGIIGTVRLPQGASIHITLICITYLSQLDSVSHEVLVVLQLVISTYKAPLCHPLDGHKCGGSPP